MNKKAVKKGFKRKASSTSSNEYKSKKHVRPKVLYNKKFSVPLKKKRKNAYDANEEARYNV